MKKILIMFVVIALMLQNGCISDITNDIRDINEVTISGIAEFIEVYQHDLLTIEPILSSTFGGAQNYAFEWVAFRFDPPVGMPIRFFLDSTRNLDNFRVDLPVDDYLVRFRVTDRETGVFFETTFTLSVKTFLTSGYLVMSDVDGRMRLDMLSLFYNEFTLFPDVLAHVNSELPPQYGPIKLLRFTDEAFSPGGYALYVLTQTGTNRLHDETLRWNPNYNVRNHFLPIATAPEDFIATNMLEGSRSVVVHGEVDGIGTLFNRFQPTGIWWNVPVNTLDGVQLFNASPIFVQLHVVNGWLVFNKDTRSFYQLRTESRRSNRIIPAGGLMSWANTGKDLVFAGRIGHTGYLILRNDNNEHFFLQVNSSFIQIDFRPMHATNIHLAEHFAVGGTWSQNIYYAVEGRVYAWNISDNASYVVLDLGDQIITYLDFVRYSANLRVTTEIYVGSFDPSTGVGTLTSFTIPIRPNPFEKVQQWTGFGRIVSVILK